MTQGDDGIGGKPPQTLWSTNRNESNSAIGSRRFKTSPGQERIEFSSFPPRTPTPQVEVSSVSFSCPQTPATTSDENSQSAIRPEEVHVDSPTRRQSRCDLPVNSGDQHLDVGTSGTEPNHTILKRIVDDVYADSGNLDTLAIDDSSPNMLKRRKLSVEEMKAELSYLAREEERALREEQEAIGDFRCRQVFVAIMFGPILVLMSKQDALRAEFELKKAEKSRSIEQRKRFAGEYKVNKLFVFGALC